MGKMTSQMTSLTIVYSTVYEGTDQGRGIYFHLMISSWEIGHRKMKYTNYHSSNELQWFCLRRGNQEEYSPTNGYLGEITSIYL